MKIIDSTLREGEQCFGVYLSTQAKKDILSRLARLGVDEVELGIAGRDESVSELSAMAQAIDNGPETSVWAACREDTIRTGAALNTDWLHLGLPVSAAHMEKRLGLTPEGLIEHLERHVELARAAGKARISVGLEDASRADPEFLTRATKAARDSGAARVRLSDTVGLWHPFEVGEVVRELKALGGVAIGVHCHNDFGLGTANALAGLLAGADYADASVLGLGERAGLAALEELVAYLHLRLAAPYRVEELPGLCRAVAQAAGIEIPPRKPVAGAGQFACETGLHVHGLARDPALFEPYDPALLGLSRSTALGKKSGRAAVAAKLAELKIEASTRDLEALVRSVRTESERLGRPLTDQEAMRLLS
ncbi:MAG: pyruvate carboxyltransferase [Desulfovibrio sp.]|nr:pyruvate carboxyltransferase [Desulfovibrio sp.]MBI4961567.1 pyruvate carboxyltransferase [Desulfovibrio sp.]